MSGNADQLCDAFSAEGREGAQGRAIGAPIRFATMKCRNLVGRERAATQRVRMHTHPLVPALPCRERIRKRRRGGGVRAEKEKESRALEGRKADSTECAGVRSWASLHRFGP